MCHSHGALVRVISSWKKCMLEEIVIRESKEKSCRNNHQNSSCNIDGLVPRVLQSATSAEERVASEIFPVLARVTPRGPFFLDVYWLWRGPSRGQSLMAPGVMVVLCGSLVLQGQKREWRLWRRILRSVSIVICTQIQVTRTRLVLLVPVLKQPDTLAEASDCRIAHRTGIGDVAIRDDGIRELGPS